MHCPSLNIFGTFFPSWMLCALVGIVGAVAVFKLLSALHIGDSPRLLVYPSIALAITSLTWLGFYGH
ncbi:MAG TPA: YtcA family lipoprotein [Myxococcales bacterium]|nr:YtcA family lipoprotein [Myxococcales bacterium]